MGPLKVNLCDMELDAVDRNYARRLYRVMRIAMYAPQSSGRTPMYQGCYGMERPEAKQFVADVFAEIAWKIYLGSK